MNFTEPEACAAVRTEVAEFVAAHVDGEVIDHEHRTGDGVHPTVHKLMGERGWLTPMWPVAEGGRGYGPHECATLRMELGRAGVPLVGAFTTLIPANTIRALGSDGQRASVLPRVASGDLLIALGYTEPESGSDVAAARTRATRTIDGWRIDGQKVFTTFAHLAGACFLLARTDPDAPKHRGLTTFLVPLHSPGIEIHPVHTLGGERTNIVYYDAVEIPDEARIGEVNGGWGVLRHALAHEHVGGLAPEAARLWDLTISWAHTGDGGSRPIDDRDVRRALALVGARNEVARLLGDRLADLAEHGRPIGPAGPMANLYGPESYLANVNTLVDAIGPTALLGGGGDLAAAAGEIEHLFRAAVAATIYGGTSEVMRGLIAETALGLPRAGRA